MAETPESMIGSRPAPCGLGSGVAAGWTSEVVLAKEVRSRMSNRGDMSSSGVLPGETRVAGGWWPPVELVVVPSRDRSPGGNRA